MLRRHIHMRVVRMRLKAFGLIVAGRLVRPPFAADDNAVVVSEFSSVFEMAAYLR